MNIYWSNDLPCEGEPTMKITEKQCSRSWSNIENLTQQEQNNSAKVEAIYVKVQQELTS